MKRNLLRAIVPLVLLLLGTPGAAHANELGFWRWLDRLSGPGPCNGVIYDQQLFSSGATITGQNDGLKPFFDPGGLKLDETATRHPVRYGFQWGVFRCDNKLPYVGREAPTVWAFPIAGTVDVGVFRGVDVGVTLGATGFVGDHFSAWQPTIAPRVTVAPAALFSREPSRRQRAVLLRVTASTILGELDAEDFGATGDFKGGNEVLWGVSLSLNVLALRR